MEHNPLPVNANATVIKVAHGSLERMSPNKTTVECPVCVLGLIDPERDRITMRVLGFARCNLCAQQVEWTDHDELVKELGF